MGELWKGFFPLMMVVSIWQREVWNAKYLFLVEEWEQLYFKKTMESMCFGFYYLDVPTFCCWKLCRMLMQPPAWKSWCFAEITRSTWAKGAVFRGHHVSPLFQSATPQRPLSMCEKSKLKSTGGTCALVNWLGPFLVGYQTASKRHQVVWEP